MFNVEVPYVNVPADVLKFPPQNMALEPGASVPEFVIFPVVVRLWPLKVSVPADPPPAIVRDAMVTSEPLITGLFAVPEGIVTAEPDPGTDVGVQLSALAQSVVEPELAAPCHVHALLLKTQLLVVSAVPSCELTA